MLNICNREMSFIFVSVITFVLDDDNDDSLYVFNNDKVFGVHSKNVSLVYYCSLGSKV
jgi:hypothetical protein